MQNKLCDDDKEFMFEYQLMGMNDSIIGVLYSFSPNKTITLFCPVRVDAKTREFRKYNVVSDEQFVKFDESQILSISYCSNLSDEDWKRYTSVYNEEDETGN